MIRQIPPLTPLALLKRGVFSIRTSAVKGIKDLYPIGYYMGCEPDDWALEWLEKQRANGEKGLTIEKRGGIHIVKWATTKWDPETKKRKKISEYRGVLDPDGTLRDPRPMRSRIDVADIRDSGNARLLAKVSESIVDSLRMCFPYDHPEIVELVFARLLGRGELNKCGRCWNRLEDVMGLRPNTSPKSLSQTLENVGLGRRSQDMFFGDMRTEDPEMAVDMSVIFSKARGAFLSKRGYNRFNLTYPQFNLLLVCGLASGRPQYMKVLPGNAKEGSAVTMLDEFDIPEGTLLVGDRGYNDGDFLKAAREKGLDYLVAVKRNSFAYARTDTKEGMFAWGRSAISYGHTKIGEGEWAYRFENLNNRNDELVDALRSKTKGKKREPDAEKAGNFVMISSREMSPQDAYRIYKARCEVENCFDTGKNILSADRTHMHDDAHVLGHLFITFVAMMVRFEISKLLEENGLSPHTTPEDVLDTYGTMKVMAGNADIRQIVPKDVRELDAQLGLFLYSTQDDRDRLNGIKKKRGRKPRASAPSS